MFFSPPDAFKVDISLKDIKGKALFVSCTICFTSTLCYCFSCNSKYSQVFVLPCLRFQLFSPVVFLSANLPLVCNIGMQRKTGNNCSKMLLGSSFFTSWSLRLHVISSHVNRSLFCLELLMFVAHS